MALNKQAILNLKTGDEITVRAPKGTRPLYRYPEGQEFTATVESIFLSEPQIYFRIQHDVYHGNETTLHEVFNSHWIDGKNWVVVRKVRNGRVS